MASFFPRIEPKCETARIAARRSHQILVKTLLTRRSHRALSHNFDQVGAIIRGSVNIAHQTVGGDFHAIDRGCRPVRLQRRLDDRHAITPSAMRRSSPPERRQTGSWRRTPRSRRSGGRMSQLRISRFGLNRKRDLGDDSPSSSAVVNRPLKKSSAEIVRLLVFTVARAPAPRPDNRLPGSLLATEPPMVPRYRTAGSPITEAGKPELEWPFPPSASGQRRNRS